LLEGNPVFIRGRNQVEEKINVIAGLMLVLPPHLRTHLTFATEDFAPRPCWRRVTFAPNRWASVQLDWHGCSRTTPSQNTVHPLVSEWGAVFAKNGLAALLDDTQDPRHRSLAFDTAKSVK
jgi:hypothetical protein